MNIKFRKATDKYFTEKLIRENMEPYYKELRIDWDQGLFEKNWDAFENYTLLVDFKPVGVLRLSHDHLAYYIRDLQVDHRWQSKGIGTKAIEYAVEIARNRRFELLRLRVFRKNPAVLLYERMGFRIRKTEDKTHYMERKVS